MRVKLVVLDSGLMVLLLVYNVMRYQTYSKRYILIPLVPRDFEIFLILLKKVIIFYIQVTMIKIRVLWLK